jgi:hypothetical protein
MVFKIIISRRKMNMASIKEIKYKMEAAAAATLGLTPVQDAMAALYVSITAKAHMSMQL